MKRVLLIVTFSLLLMPYLQHRFSFLPQGVLHGYFSYRADTALTPATWFSGIYQERINDYYNDRMGFRPELLRLNAQIDYSLFRKVTFGGTALGKDNYLFYHSYIDAYYGRDYAGETLLCHRMLKLKRLQDTLSALGKTIVFVAAPCKVWYYPEFLPERSQYPPGTGNNYVANVRLADSLHINVVDFNKWFQAMKNTSRARLYSRQGIHWTNYGAILAADSLAGYLGQIRRSVLPRPRLVKLDYTTQARTPDNDMLFILNLLFPVAADTLCYPQLAWPQPVAVSRPSAIIIGDSYVINLLRTEVVQHMFSDWQFWFYFKNLVTRDNYQNPDQSGKVADSQWREALDNADCILLLYTPMNHAHLGDGFIEQAYDIYFPEAGG